MSHRKFIGAALAFAGLIAVPSGAYAASDPMGVWVNNTGRGAIEIKQCGSRLCGHVVWVKNEKDKEGCGRQIIGNVAKVGKRTWGRGWIYSPERGRRFDVELTPLSNGKLKVLGFAGSKFFSKTMYWTKAPADLKRCDEKATVAKKETATEKKKAAKKTTAPKTKSVTKTATPKKNTVAKTVKEQEQKAAHAQENAPSEPEEDEIAQGEEHGSAPEAASERTIARTDAEDLESDIENDEAEVSEDEEGQPIDELAPVANKGPNLGDLPIDKFFKKSGKRCKLDLPWVKINFECDKL